MEHIHRGFSQGSQSLKDKEVRPAMITGEEFEQDSCSSCKSCSCNPSKTSADVESGLLAAQKWCISERNIISFRIKSAIFQLYQPHRKYCYIYLPIYLFIINYVYCQY